MTSNNLAPDAPDNLPPVIETDERTDAERGSGIKQLAIVAAIALAFAVFKPDLFKTVAIFVVTLGVLVFVHEWGHFQFARWAGLKVNRFALGFPPFIYTKHHKGIAYSIGALPIGGMVDIAGLGSEEEMVAEARGQGVAPVRNTSRPRGQKQFQDVNLGWRFLTLFAGPLMNFLLAVALFIFVFSVAGLPMPSSFKARIDSVVAGQSAEKAGVKEGDEIIAVGGQKADNPDAVSKALKSGGANATTLTVLRDGKTQTLQIKPEMRDLNKNGKMVPAIGIGFDPEAVRSFRYQKVSPQDAVKYGVQESVAISMSILNLVKRAFTGKLEAQERKAIGGPVKIAKVMNTAADFGWPVLFNIAAMLSVNLGLLNLLPFPALDGGRILFLGYELVMRRPIDPRKEGLVHMAGMVMLLAFMVFITLRDVNFFKLIGQ